MPESIASGIAGIILAGGLGTRLRDVISDRPKVLAPVMGRPFVTYLLDQFAAAGIDEVLLCTGHLGEQVRDTLGDAYDSIRLFYSQEFTPLGTGGALRRALPLVGRETVLVTNGDSYLDMEWGAFLARHRATGARATLLLARGVEGNRFGRVQTDAAGRVTGFVEKEASSGQGGAISAGIYLIERSLLETIPVGRAVSLEREIFPSWIGRGLYGDGSDGRFLDIGTAESYAAAEAFFDGVRASS